MSTPSLPPIWNDFPAIHSDLRAVIAKINQSWELGFPEIDQAIRSQLAAGKLVRPVLTIMFSQLADGQAADSHEAMIDLAASVELLHLATLIHDDIVDESKLRRGQASIQDHFGKDTAVYAGDYLLTGMFQLIAQANRPQLNGLVVESLQSILHGELSQKQDRYDTQVSFDEYIDRIKGKTGALFNLAAFFGINSGSTIPSSELSSLVAGFCEKMGIMFQLLDDYLDFASLADDNQLGKPVGQDLLNGTYTAPILFALEEESVQAPLTALLDKRNTLSEQDLAEVQRLVLSSNAMQRLTSLLEDYHQDLVGLIDKLPSKDLQAQLKQLSHVLAARQQ